MDRVVALIDSALKLAVEIQVTLPEEVFPFKVDPSDARSKRLYVNTPDAQTSSGPKLVDFKAALVKPENEVITRFLSLIFGLFATCISVM